MSTTPPTPTPPSTPNSIMSSLTSRINTQKAVSFLPVYEHMVCFSLAAIETKLHRFAAIRQRKDQAFLDRLMLLIEEDSPKVNHLTHQLNTHWDACHFHGAALMYALRDEVKASLVERQNDEKAVFHCWQSTDPVLTLNVLARSKSQILIGRGELALERGYLERTLLSDDPRLVALVQANGLQPCEFSA